MADSTVLEINDLIQIRIPGDNAHWTYTSRIEGLSDGAIWIAWPTDAGVRVPFHLEEELLISFRRNGMVYEVRAQVQKRIAEPKPVIALKTVSRVTGIERRENVRAHAHIQVELNARVISIADAMHTRQSLHILTSTRTLSGSGFAFYHHAAIPVGTLFDVKLSIPGHPRALAVSAKVVRCDALEEPEGESCYEIGVAYFRISEAARSQIVSHIFKIQQLAARNEAGEET